MGVLLSRSKAKQRARADESNTLQSPSANSPMAGHSDEHLTTDCSGQNYLSLPIHPSIDAFSNAHVHNHGGTLTTNAWNLNAGLIQIAQGLYGQGQEKLRDLVVNNAMHTGDVRGESLRCGPNTRQAIIHNVMSWIEDDYRTNNVLWLLGPVGIGKSAIAKSIADCLDTKRFRAQVVGSFFFFKNDPKRNCLNYLIPTLVYRLTVCIGIIGKEIDRIIEKDPRILDADLEAQWRKMIIEPVLAVGTVPPSVIILDGLDECGRENEQRRVLDLVAACGSNFPLAFLICSRPEPQLVNSFGSPPLSWLCRPRIDLAAYKDSNEMRNFIRSRFTEIYSRHRDILQFYAVDGVWPSEDVIDVIVERADGQYIYPTTLFKHIDDDTADPHEHLQACVEQTPEAFSPLDALYLLIMKSSHQPDDMEMQDLLFLIGVPVPRSSDLPSAELGVLSLTILSTLLDLKRPTCRLKLRKLHSVIFVPDNDYEEIRVHHKSFIDFLFDRRRSGRYGVDQVACALRVIGSCLSLLEKGTAHDDLYLLYYWWSHSRHLSTPAPQSILQRLEKFDFYKCLRPIAGYFWTDLQEVDSVFVEVCKSSNYPSELVEKYNTDALREVLLVFFLKKYYVCHWADCINCSDQHRTKVFSGIMLREHPGLCPLSWNALLALAKASSLHGKFLLDAFMVLTDVMEADDFVLVSLIVLSTPNFLHMLTKSDQEYLQTWSRAWTSYPTSNLKRAWMHTSSRSTNRHPPAARKLRDGILKRLRQLPEERHYHELNRVAVLKWLNSNFDKDAPLNLIMHWKT